MTCYNNASANRLGGEVVNVVGSKGVGSKIEGDGGLFHFNGRDERKMRLTEACNESGRVQLTLLADVGNAWIDVNISAASIMLECLQSQ